MSRLLALAISLAPSTAFSAQGDTWLNIHGFSRHLDYQTYYTPVETNEFNVVTQEEYTAIHYVPEQFNEFNFGLGFGYELVDGIEARAGGYFNSFNKASFYGGLNFHTSHDRLLGVGLMVGAISGYDDKFTGAGDTINAMALPTLSINVSNVRAEFGYIPASKKNKTDVVTLSFGVRY